jgi:hypothetical protein
VDVQTILVILVALGAVAYLGRAVWRTWSGSGCKSGCGCGPKKQEGPKLIAPDELLVRVRTGEPQRLRGEHNWHNSDNFSA